MPLSELPLELELAVTILGHEKRRAIFEILWRESHRYWDGELGLTFEELRQATGFDTSAALSYHLNLLKSHGERHDWDRFGPTTDAPVHGKTSSQLIIKRSDHYILDKTLARRIIQIWAHALPAHDQVELTPVPWDCPYCDKQLSVTVRHHRLDLWCEAHGHLSGYCALPGTSDNHNPADLVRLAAFDHARRWLALLEGFCGLCHGPVDGTVLARVNGRPVVSGERGEPVADALADVDRFPIRFAEHTYHDPDTGIFEPFGLARDCANCGLSFTPNLAILVCYRPAMISFFADQGISITTEPIHWRYVDDAGIVESIDPVRISLSLQVEDVTCTITVDEQARIVDGPSVSST